MCLPLHELKRANPAERVVRPYIRGRIVINSNPRTKIYFNEILLYLSNDYINTEHHMWCFYVLQFRITRISDRIKFLTVCPVLSVHAVHRYTGKPRRWYCDHELFPAVQGHLPIFLQDGLFCPGSASLCAEYTAKI